MDMKCAETHIFSKFGNHKKIPPTISEMLPKHFSSQDSNKTGYPVTGGATLAVSVSLISKLACYIHKTCDKKNCQKLQAHNICKKLDIGTRTKFFVALNS